MTNERDLSWDAAERISRMFAECGVQSSLTSKGEGTESPYILADVPRIGLVIIYVRWSSKLRPVNLEKSEREKMAAAVGFPFFVAMGIGEDNGLLLLELDILASVLGAIPSAEFSAAVRTRPVHLSRQKPLLGHKSQQVSVLLVNEGNTAG